MRPAVGSPAADQLKVLRGVDLPVPDDVVADEEIEIAVAVVVEAAAAAAPVALIAAHPSCLGNVLEAAAAKVAKQPVGADRRDEQVGQAVAVDIARGEAGAIKGHVEAGAGGGIGELAGAVVEVEGRGRCIARRVLIPGPAAAVDEHDVGIAIGIDIDKAAAAPHRLRQQLLAGRTVFMHEVEPGCFRDICKPKHRDLHLRPFADRRHHEGCFHKFLSRWRLRGPPDSTCGDRTNRDDQHQRPPQGHANHGVVGRLIMLRVVRAGCVGRHGAAFRNLQGRARGGWMHLGSGWSWVASRSMRAGNTSSVYG